MAVPIDPENMTPAEIAGAVLGQYMQDWSPEDRREALSGPEGVGVTYVGVSRGGRETDGWPDAGINTAALQFEGPEPGGADLGPEDWRWSAGREVVEPATWYAQHGDILVEVDQDGHQTGRVAEPGDGAYPVTGEAEPEAGA